MGGGSTPQQPAPPAPAPSVGETSAQAIAAQIEALPKILAAQKEYGGQFSEETLKELETYGPKFSQVMLDLANKFAPQYTELQNKLSPEIGAAQKTLTDYLDKTDQQEYESLKPGLLEDIRSAQSARGIGDISPLGSIDESVQLQRLKQSLKDRRLNVALSTAGRVPISSIPLNSGYGAQTGTNQLIQNISPQSIFDYQSSLNKFSSDIFGTQANLYGTTYNNLTARRGQNLELIGSLVGSGAKVLAG